LNRFTTFIFDVGGTLLRFDLDKLARAYTDLAATRGITIDFGRARATIAQLEQELPTRVKGRDISLEAHNGAAFWDEFYGDGFRQLGLTNGSAAAAMEIRARFQRGEFEALHDDALPALDALQQRGVRMGILSNFSPNCVEVLAQQSVRDYFSFFVVSGVVGVEKPDPRIFDLAVRAANQRRERIVYIGDSVYHDVQGAQRAGLAAILIDRDGQHREFDGARVRDLRELENFVEGNNAHAT
jgi:HAD superfamily hydrolase (TIGR01549 family)